jgi:hypothetical protein
MAVRITSAESIKQAILADVLLREIFVKVQVNQTGLAPIALGPSVGILGIPSISDFEATWKLAIIGLTSLESKQVADSLERIFIGASFKFSNNDIQVSIFSLATREVLESAEEQQKLKKDAQRSKNLEKAIEYAENLKSGINGQRGIQGIAGAKGEPGLQGPPGRDGQDLVATEAELHDLKDVFIPDPRVGQVLTWDGASWVSLFVPQTYRYAGSGIEEAPNDGNYYVRQNKVWILLSEALGNTGIESGDFDP